MLYIINLPIRSNIELVYIILYLGGAKEQKKQSSVEWLIGKHWTTNHGVKYAFSNSPLFCNSHVKKQTVSISTPPLP